MDPLISIITPFYNASHTLSYALKSLLFQSYHNWECILVDDGSEDSPQAVLDRFHDPRILYHRLDKNRGRGAARQFALDKAKGDYLCFLDADDWMYPQKLQSQVEVFQSSPHLGLISSGMAVVDREDQMIGVRSFSPARERFQVVPPLAHPSPPIIYFPSSMIRMTVAKGVRFDQNLRRSEDADYLLQILLNHSYGLLNEIHYVYREFLIVEKKDVLLGYQSRIKVFQKYKDQYPWTSRKVILDTWLRWLLYWMAFEIGLGVTMIQHRSRGPTAQERAVYQNNIDNLKTRIGKD